MGFTLTAGRYSELEKEFPGDFDAWLQGRSNPLGEQCLIVVPTGALRRRILSLLLESGCKSLCGIRVVTLNGLSQEIVLDSLKQPYEALDDAVYFAQLLLSVARQENLKLFESYRTIKGALSTIRDLVDGLLTTDLLQQFLDDAREDGELRAQIGDLKSLQELLILYSGFMKKLQKQSMVNVQFSTALALESASNWVQTCNTTALFFYGFYDATPSQFELMENLTREIFRTGDVHVYFPFSVDASSHVEPVARFSQEFFDRLHSLRASLSGVFHTLQAPLDDSAAGGIEDALFRTGHASDLTHKIEIFNCGSPYEEAWTVAKRILNLVRSEGVRFDQICVLSRSSDSVQNYFHRVFLENQIPNTIRKEPALSTTPAGQFIYLLLRARQSHLNHNLVFELLCSPLLREPFSHPGLIRELLEILFITNSDDWHRLKPLIDDTRKLPEIFELDENDWRVEHYRRAAAYLILLKERIERIPASASMSRYAATLMELGPEIGDERRFRQAGGMDLELLLLRLTELPLNEELRLNEFVDVFGDYLQTTSSGEVLESEAESNVTVGDVMNLRGSTFDYVFLTGLNQDVFPIRATEDPFLPDALRRAIRANTGAGPHVKRAYLLQAETQDSGDEELLLLALAMRSAKQKLYLSYLRADSEGRKKSPSIFIEEILRVLTDQTSEENSFVQHVPRQLDQRLSGNYLPNAEECCRLTSAYSMRDIIGHFYGLDPDYADSTISFAEKLNSTEREESAQIDGCMDDPARFWETHVQGKLRYSYSRMQMYVKCPFMFFADRILRLESSPFQPTPVSHDLTPLSKGRLAESVVKEAITRLKRGGISIEEATEYAANRIRRKYTSYLPGVLMDHYLVQFERASRVLLNFLNQEGFDFAYSEVPGRSYIADVPLLEKLTIYGIPDIVFLGPKRLIGEMKWGSAATMDTADAMFRRGEFQFCFYPEIERQSRQLLEPLDFRYFRLNIFADIGSPRDLQEKLVRLRAPSKIDVTMRIFGNYPSADDISRNLEKLKEIGGSLLHGEFRILEDPGDYYTPCGTCRFTLLCRRTHSATLLRSKKDLNDDDTSSDFL